MRSHSRWVAIAAGISLSPLLLAILTPSTRAHPLHDFSLIATVFVPLILRDDAAPPARATPTTAPTFLPSSGSLMRSSVTAGQRPVRA